MEGTPHLLTDVKFDERRRGYDPDQVDNFLERVAEAVSQLQDKLREATARAEDADAKIAEAKRAQSVAEARADKLKADLESAGSAVADTPEKAPAPDPESTADAATNVLVMAQKAADATMDEAKRTATTTVNDARAKAATLVAEAEREAERMLSEARRKSKDMLDERSAAVLERARALEEKRDQLSGDVDALRGHLDAGREALRARLGDMLAMLDDDALRITSAPGLSGATVSDLTGDDSVAEPPAPAGEAPQADAAPDDASDDVATSAAADDAPGEVSAEASDGATEDTGDDAVESASTDDDAEEAPGGDAPATSVSGSVDTPTAAVDVVDLLDQPAPKRDLDLATERLFGTDDDEPRPVSGLSDLTGSTTDLFSTGSTDVVPREIVARDAEPSLGRTDARADEAMRAFFEADFDRNDRPESRARFGRKR